MYLSARKSRNSGVWGADQSSASCRVLLDSRCRADTAVLLGSMSFLCAEWRLPQSADRQGLKALLLDLEVPGAF